MTQRLHAISDSEGKNRKPKWALRAKGKNELTLSKVLDRINLLSPKVGFTRKTDKRQTSNLEKS